jgi:hypothetical protein
MMFDTHVVRHTAVTNVHVTNETNDHIKVTNEAQQQVIELAQETPNSFFVHCHYGDNVWKGLFYERPFLNKFISTRAACDSVEFGMTQIASYEPKEKVAKLLEKQGVVIKKLKVMDKSRAVFAEVVWADQA